MGESVLGAFSRTRPLAVCGSACADTKLVPCVLLGGRDAGSGHEFIADLASRPRYKIQLTSDGHRPYLEAVESAFGGNVALNYFACNFIKIHRTLRMTPAMADLVMLLEASESPKAA